FGQAAVFMDGIDYYRNVVLTRKGNSGCIHDRKPAIENFLVRQAIETRGVRIFLRVGGINSVNLRALQKRIRLDFGSAKSRRRIRREEWVSSTASKDHDLALIHVGRSLSL